MDIKEMESIIEAILFAAGDPVPIARLCSILEADKSTVELVAQQLADRYAYDRRGIRLLKLDGSLQLTSSPEYADYIRRTLESRKPPVMSQPALEVLSIVAYYQPTTKAYIDQIRGVDSGYTIGVLCDKGLIAEAGRLDVPGKPILYRTTKAFLRAFCLSSVEDLPPLPDLFSGSDGQLSFDAGGDNRPV